MSPGRVASGRRVGLGAAGLLCLAALSLLAVLIPGSALATNIYVSDGEANTISAFTVNPSGSLAPLSCSGLNCQTGSAPQGVAMTPNGRFLYTVNADSDTVSAFRIVSGGALRPIPCRQSSCATGTSPYWLAVSPSGRFLYVSNYEQTRLSAYRIRRNGSLLSVRCRAGCGTLIGAGEPAITPSGRYLYVPISSSDRLLAYLIRKNGALTPLACGHGCVTPGQDPWTAAITPNGHYLYTTYWSSDQLSAFRIHSDGSLSRIPCGGCTTQSTPYGLAVSPDGRHVYVAEFDSGMIAQYAVGGNGALSPSPCASRGCDTQPFPVAVTPSPSGDYIYAATGSNVVSPFSTAGGGLLRPIACLTACGGLNGPEYGQAIVARPDQVPRASFTHTHHRRHFRFNARRSAAMAGQIVTSYHWNFGDGHRLMTHAAKVLHTYARAGRHRVTLTVTDGAGCSTRLVFTGQTAYCNGSGTARISHRVTS